ncbi:fused MFS/spermidine synthase [Thermodesulfobacteriota bacterium]
MFTEKQINFESSWYNTHLVSALILSCFFLSGLASLIYQVLWVRMIDKVIGSAPFAVASVLAVFMGGLALGSYLAGKYIDRITPQRKLLSLYGIVEVAIGIYSLLIPSLIVLTKPIYAAAYNLIFQYFWIYQVFTLLGCTLLLILPTALMGVTLPVLCRFYVIHLDHLGERSGRLYGLNTVGAAVGALLCGFFLINSLGVWGTLFIAAAINFIVGILCILLGQGMLPFTTQAFENNPSENVSVKASNTKTFLMETDHDPAITWALLIFAVSGFSFMAYEVIWTRLLGLIIGPTTYSFTIVVSTFIIGLAVGSLFFGWLSDRIKKVFPLLAWTQLGAAGLALFVSQFLGNSQIFFAKLIYTLQNQFGEMILVQFIVVFFILLGPTVLAGATFPLVNRIYARSLPVIGKSIGTAYALNTIGAILGSIVAGFILIPFMGKENGLRLVIALQFTLSFSALAALGLRIKVRARQWCMLAFVSILGLILLLNFPSWNRQLLSSGWYRDFEEQEDYLNAATWLDTLYRIPKIQRQFENLSEVVFYADGTGGFTTVQQWTDIIGKVQYALINSGKPDASSHGDRSTQTLLAHVPLLFHPQPEKVMVLGLASGMTAGEVLHYPVKQLDVLEINDQVVKASNFFRPWNNDLRNDPRTRIIVQDGRNHLALTREKYDVIISEPSNPWMAGLANLYTLEFFQTVKDRLKENGIFVQWIHSYEMDWSTFAMVGRTFTEVFPDGLLMTTTPEEEVDHLLIGFSGPKVFDLKTAAENIKYARQSKNIFIKDPSLLFHFIIAEDLKRFFGNGPLHTDYWPRLEFAAPKQLYKDNFSIEEIMNAGGWLSPETRTVIEAGNRMDVLLDLVEFSAMSYSDLPFRETINLDDATPTQKERYRKIVRAYCNEIPVSDYEIFPEDKVKKECAKLQAVKIQQHLAIDPEDAEAYSLLGVALIKLGKTEEAILAWQRAVAINPFDFEMNNNLGLAFAELGNVKQAIHYYNEALHIRPNRSWTHNDMGVALIQLGRFEDAISHFSEALRFTPDNVEVHNNLGAALARQGKVKEAIRHFSEVLRLKPDDVEAHYNKGLSLTELGNVKQAINHYSEVLRIKPDNAEAHNNLGALLVRQGNLQDAVHHFSEALRIKPDKAEARNNLEIILRKMGQSDELPSHLSDRNTGE